MASFPKHFPLFILFTILAPIHTHARESQFFNKALAKTNDDVVPAYSIPKQLQNDHPQQEPIFLPDNDNGYGLYGHESGQLHPSAVTTTGAAESAAYKTEPKQPDHKHLPKNYNPVAYVTEPVDLSETTTSTYEEKRFPSKPDIDSFFYDGDRNYHNSPQEEDSEFRNYPTAAKKTGNGDNDRYSLGSSFNSGGGGGSLSRRDNYFNRGADGANGFEPQGMSDTRSLENGRYFYDVNTEKYSSNHPYESLKGFKERNWYDNRNNYGNEDIGYGGQDSMAGYQNQYEFRDEDNRNLRP